MTRRLGVTLTIVLGAGLLLGCGDGETSSTGSSASSSSGGMGEGGAGGGGQSADWSCLGMVTPPMPAGAMAGVTMILGLHPDSAPLKGADVKACAKGDPMCAAPVDEQMSNDQGMVTLTVPTGTDGFDGHIDVSSPAILPSLIFLYPRITQTVSG